MINTFSYRIFAIQLTALMLNVAGFQPGGGGWGWEAHGAPDGGHSPPQRGRGGQQRGVRLRGHQPGGHRNLQPGHGNCGRSADSVVHLLSVKYVLSCWKADGWNVYKVYYMHIMIILYVLYILHKALSTIEQNMNNQLLLSSYYIINFLQIETCNVCWWLISGAQQLVSIMNICKKLAPDIGWGGHWLVLDNFYIDKISYYRVFSFKN